MYFKSLSHTRHIGDDYMLMTDFLLKLNVYLEEEHVTYERIKLCNGGDVIEAVKQVVAGCYNSEHIIDGFDTDSNLSLTLYGYPILNIDNNKECVSYVVANDNYSNLTIHGIRVLVAAMREYEMIVGHSGDVELINVIKKITSEH